MTKDQQNRIDLEQGWDFIQKGITKLKSIIEGQSEAQFSSEEYMEIYTTIYGMCTQKPPHDYSQQLYEKYHESIEEYIKSTVLPALREKHDESMLRELVQRWSNHKIMVHSMSRFFHYIDRYFLPRRSLPSLKEVGITCFRDLVFMKLSGKARAAVLSLIDKERDGEQIDHALLKNVLDIFYFFEEKNMTRMDYLYVESEVKTMDDYETDFEEAMLNDTAAYYSQKASNWVLEDSCPIYMSKAEECLKREKDMVSHYLCSSMETKLLEKVQHELLSVYATQLLEGCHALLRDDKVEDLSRMYRLFSKIPQGLEPIAAIFKQHVTTEGTALVKQAEDAASNNSQQNFGCTTSTEIQGWVIINCSLEQAFVGKVIELHEKYMAYVNDCFSNDSLFHQALKEAFEVICNKGVAGSSSAEVVATFCDDILKKGASKKLSDEAIEETLEKALFLPE